MGSVGGKKGAKRKGRPRKKNYIANYYSGNYFRNKLRRILKSSGVKAASEWAKNHTGSWSIFEKLKNKMEAK